MAKTQGRRTYVLDTSVLLADPAAITRFDEHQVVLPIVVIYRKFYGTRFTLAILALMFVTMVAAALIVDGYGRMASLAG